MRRVLVMGDGDCFRSNQLGKGRRIKGSCPHPVVPAHATLTLVRKQELGGAHIADGSGGGAQPVTQIVVVVGPLDVVLGEALATRTTVMAVRVLGALVQLGDRAADQGEHQKHGYSYRALDMDDKSQYTF